MGGPDAHHRQAVGSHKALEQRKPLGRLANHTSYIEEQLHRQVGQLQQDIRRQAEPHMAAEVGSSCVVLKICRGSLGFGMMILKNRLTDRKGQRC